MPKVRNVVPRVSLSDVVYERLREEIMAGDLEDGADLNQVSLAEHFGVSRIPVREALRRLQAEGFVISSPYYPFVVRQISADQILELVDIRAALEDLALARRGPVPDADIATMRSLNKSMSSGKDAARFLEFDRHLHRVLAGDNAITVAMIDDVRDKVHREMSRVVSESSVRKSAVVEHKAIIDALAADDRRLARAELAAHIQASRASIARRLGLEDRSCSGSPVAEQQR